MNTSGRDFLRHFHRVSGFQEWRPAAQLGAVGLTVVSFGGFMLPVLAQDVPSSAMPAAILNAAEPAPSQDPRAAAHESVKSELKVVSDKRKYTHGDIMTLTVEVPRDGYLRLYGVSVDGSTVLLFPNKWVQDDKVSKGSLILPGKNAAYDFMLTLDNGQTHVTESVHAVFSFEPFTDSGRGKIKFGNAKFEGVGITNTEQRITRGIVPTAKVTASSVEAKYELNR